MTYDKLIKKLQSFAESEFAAFQRRLISTNCIILGVRTPILRRIAKEWKAEVERLLSFPDTYYEVRFIKLAAVAHLPYEQLIHFLPQVVPIIDNWSLCDSFRPKCITKHLTEFLPYIEFFFLQRDEFSVRYALVALLVFYMDEEYFPVIIGYLKRTDTQPYYVHMAAAWLTSEVLVKSYQTGIEILKSRILDVKTHNKAIQKAMESFRLTQEQKECLRALKIKIK